MEVDCPTNKPIVYVTYVPPPKIDKSAQEKKKMMHKLQGKMFSKMTNQYKIEEDHLSEEEAKPPKILLTIQQVN